MHDPNLTPIPNIQKIIAGNLTAIPATLAKANKNKDLFKRAISCHANFVDGKIEIVVDQIGISLAIPEAMQKYPKIVADQLAVDIGMAVAEMLVPEIRKAIQNG